MCSSKRRIAIVLVGDSTSSARRTLIAQSPEEHLNASTTCRCHSGSCRITTLGRPILYGVLRQLCCRVDRNPGDIIVYGLTIACQGGMRLPKPSSHLPGTLSFSGEGILSSQRCMKK